jgi:hypothetical protein
LACISDAFDAFVAAYPEAKGEFLCSYRVRKLRGGEAQAAMLILSKNVHYVPPTGSFQYQQYKIPVIATQAATKIRR